MIEGDQEKPIEAEYEIVSHGEEVDSNFDSSKASYEQTTFQSAKPVSIWKAKLIFWAIIIGGLALLILLLISFAALFVYFFIPIMIILGCWLAIKFLFQR